MLTNEQLHELFEYEPSGMLRRKIPGRNPYPWRGAGRDRRYLIAEVGKRAYYLHRLIWQYHYGFVPNLVDHINGDTNDNRIENLRECTNAQNQYNSKTKANNRCGYKGVVYHKKCVSRPWQAKIVVDKKVRSLGYYATPEEAHSAYVVASLAIAGEFAFANRSQA